ncbi:hypothetical protein SPONN_995 [uncultured Candidatus Thioglobus sp.]|nr:hypothetical protein SPONN_995 [uncultured Candidatus Thioglobus sp.]
MLTDESHYNGSIKPEYKSKAEGHIIKIDELIFEVISVINQH